MCPVPDPDIVGSGSQVAECTCCLPVCTSVCRIIICTITTCRIRYYYSSVIRSAACYINLCDHCAQFCRFRNYHARIQNYFTGRICSIPYFDFITAGSEVYEAACQLPTANSANCKLICAASAQRIGYGNYSIIGSETGYHGR